MPVPSRGLCYMGPGMEKHGFSLEAHLLPPSVLLGAGGVGGGSQVRMYSREEELRVPEGPACPTNKGQSLRKNNNTSDILKSVL